jgi:hypothetical protein
VIRVRCFGLCRLPGRAGSGAVLALVLSWRGRSCDKTPKPGRNVRAGLRPSETRNARHLEARHLEARHLEARHLEAVYTSKGLRAARINLATPATPYKRRQTSTFTGLWTVYSGLVYMAEKHGRQGK